MNFLNKKEKELFSDFGNINVVKYKYFDKSIFL